MRSLPKPLIGLLLSTVVFFALWMVALKPSSSSSGGAPNGVGQYQSAINKAHQAVATSKAANAKLGSATGTPAAGSHATPKSKPASITAAQLKKLQAGFTRSASSPAAKAWVREQHAKIAAEEKVSKEKMEAAMKALAASTLAPPKATPANELVTLKDAIGNHDVVAILFYNPASADDKAMKQELAAVPTDSGEVVTMAIPVSELTQFKAITAEIPVVTSPTLIIIDPSRQATTLTGYASQVEIDQRVADALPTP